MATADLFITVPVHLVLSHKPDYNCGDEVNVYRVTMGEPLPAETRKPRDLWQEIFDILWDMYFNPGGTAIDKVTDDIFELVDDYYE